jgi:Skp family chaperone for outer membrane proteins
MRTTTRILIAGSLGLGALAGFVARPSLGQNDPKVQKTATSAPAGTAARPAAPVTPAVIGSIDMERAIQEYQRYKDSSAKFQSESMNGQKELQNMLAEAKSVAEMREKYKIGTPDYNKFNDKLAEIEAKFQAEKQKMSTQFAQAEAGAVAEIFNDIRQMCEAVAKNKNMNFVVQVGKNEALTGENPDQVMATLSRNVVYYNPASDITNDVIYALNYYYKKKKESAGTATPAPAPAPAGAAPAAAPAAGN